MADELTQRYGDFLEGSYDCVDRIVLNAYFRLCYSGGGFREWWRRLICVLPGIRTGGTAEKEHPVRRESYGCFGVSNRGGGSDAV